jgi:hypothetical protein
VTRRLAAVPALDVPAVDVTDTSASSSGMGAALDEVEQAARDGGVLYVDVALQLALARYLVGVTERIRIGESPTGADVHALRELRLAVTELRQLVVEYARVARR